ncbi:MAG: sugar kinase, ribokinase family, partial [halophilic archaeon J07HB67]
MLVTIGAATVDRHYAVSNLPAPDGGAYAPAVTDHPGGVAANVASGVSHLGRAASLLSRVGDGDVGQTVREGLAD